MDSFIEFKAKKISGDIFVSLSNSLFTKSNSIFDTDKSFILVYLFFMALF